MASLGSQGEGYYDVVPTKLPNLEDTQICEGENESVRCRRHFAAFTRFFVYEGV